MTERTSASIARFLVVGLANTCVGLVIIFVSLRLGAADVTANALGYGTGLIVSFFGNKKWAFRHTGAIWPAFLRFMLVFAVAYGSNLATTLMMLRLLGNGSFVAQVAGMIPYTILSFLGSHLIAFKPQKQSGSSLQ